MQKEIVVIGGGPGGYVAAIRAAQLGARVTLIEGHKLGGTCLNYGCIPTKALYRNAELMNTLARIEDFGISVGNVSLDVAVLQSRKDAVVHQLVSGVAQLLKANGVEVIEGMATFTGPHSFKVACSDGSEQTVTCPNIVIATGAHPAMPPIQGLDLPGVVDSRALLAFETIPKRLLVLGGGVVAMEFAGIFAGLGSEVSVAIRSDRILKTVDLEVAKRFTAGLKKRGITLHKSIQMKAIERTDAGALALVGDGPKGPVSLEADAILVSTGRAPNLQGLGLDAAGITYTKKGIAVDDGYRTNQPGVYAIGDVNGQIMLAHAASHQGIAAVEHIMGHPHGGHHHAVPSCIFVFPEMASVGYTEEDAKAAGIAYTKSKFMFGASGKALAMGEPEGFVKVIGDADGVVIGVHIMGHNASDLIAEGTLAVANRLTIDAVANTIHAHPTLAEAFAEATLGLRGEAIHMKS